MTTISRGTVSFAYQLFSFELQKGHYGFAYLIASRFGFLEGLELNDLGKKAYQLVFKIGQFDNALKIAREVYGEDSEEWNRAVNALEDFS